MNSQTYYYEMGNFIANIPILPEAFLAFAQLTPVNFFLLNFLYFLYIFQLRSGGKALLTQNKTKNKKKKHVELF